MFQPAANLSGTAFDVRAKSSYSRPLFGNQIILHYDAAALRANRWELKRLAVYCPSLNPDDSRDDFPFLLHLHQITNTKVELRYLVSIVKSSSRHDRTTYLYRLQFSHWSQHTRPSHLNGDASKLSDAGLSGILV